MGRARAVALSFVVLIGTTQCFESGERWYLEGLASRCDAGTLRCGQTRLERCVETSQGNVWQLLKDCRDQDQVCAPGLFECTPCAPGTNVCDGSTVMRCSDDGSELEPLMDCTEEGFACREGGCQNLCAVARARRSNVGCEYWAADLDNAMIDDSLNAAAQQYAIVLSNAQPDVSATVTIEQDDAAPGEESDPVEVASAVVPPFSTRVFKLGPREVDGSEPGTYNTGTNTALTRAAYRVQASVPIVAYQFNPLENVNVFSNDASLLKPLEAVTPTSDDFREAYLVLGWPHTIADTDDPRTDFSSDDDSTLRAFLTIVGTRPKTRVRVVPSTPVVAGGPIDATQPGEPIDIELDPFEVLNLETEDFNADFTGSSISADGPVVVFTGNEASDAPFFDTLSRRQCCADHLEEQLDPIRTAGRFYVATVSPNRSRAVREAGGEIGEAEQPEFFRLMAVTEGGARVSTSRSGASAHFELKNKGDFVNIQAFEHFAIEADAPVMLESVSPSQNAAGVPRGLPGGDPSLLIVPPIEQFRSTYVFLTPDKYSFDFIRIVAPPDAVIVFDGRYLEDVDGCATASVPWPTDLPPGATLDVAREDFWAVHTCQLSFPVIDPDLSAPDNLSPGLQDDGVHRIESDQRIGVLVDGFDSFVSYAYAAGTELELIVPE